LAENRWYNETELIGFIIDRILIWWLRTGRYGWSRIRRRLFEGRYLGVTLPSVNSIEDIQACLKQVIWTKDGPLHFFDCISYPQVTWEKKKDDCDGFAGLAGRLLFQCDSDYKPVLLTAMVRPVSLSHTVCVFTGPQGDFWFFDNSNLHSEGYRTYDEVIKKISEKAARLICWDVRNPLTLEAIEFHNIG